MNTIRSSQGSRMRTTLAVLVTLVLVAVTAVVGWIGTNRAAAADRTSPAKCRSNVRPTVVLVHGAWADTGSWSAVVRRLQDDGYPVRVFRHHCAASPVTRPL